MKFQYDKTYKPTAPSIEIALGLPEQALVVGPIRALVDTGADIVLVPMQYIEKLNAESDNERYLRGYSDERIPVKLFILDIAIAQARFPALAVAGYAGAEVIVGRNLLNKMLITLNGPKQELEIKI